MGAATPMLTPMFPAGPLGGELLAAAPLEGKIAPGVPKAPCDKVSIASSNVFDSFTVSTGPKISVEVRGFDEPIPVRMVGSIKLPAVPAADLRPSSSTFPP